MQNQYIFWKKVFETSMQSQICFKKSELPSTQQVDVKNVIELAKVRLSIANPNIPNKFTFNLLVGSRYKCFG